MRTLAETKKLRETLLQMRLDGLTASQSAAKVGMTRSAVLGVLNRADHAADKSGKPRVAKGKSIMRTPRVAKVTLIAPPKPSPPADAIDMEELTSKTCRWPVTDDSPFKFCGAPPMENKIYCVHHEWKAHNTEKAAAA